MEPRAAQNILLKLRKKYPLSKAETEAVMTAIGVLDSAAFTKTRIKRLFQKRKEQFNRSLKQ